MKRNKPDNDESTYGTKGTLDRGDLSEWEYLTKLYDHDELFDNHHTSAVGNEAQLPSHGGDPTVIPSNIESSTRDSVGMHQKTILRRGMDDESIPSNISILESSTRDSVGMHQKTILRHGKDDESIPSNISILESSTRDSVGMHQKTILRHGKDDESTNIKSELLPHTQLSMIATESSNNQNIKETDPFRFPVSSEHQHVMIEPGRYSDRYQPSTAWNRYSQQHPMLSESLPKRAHHDRTANFDQSFARPGHLPSDMNLLQVMEVFETSKHSGNPVNRSSSALETIDDCKETHLNAKDIFRSRNVSATNTEVPLEPWYPNRDLHVSEATLEAPLAQWEAQNLEPMHMHLVQDATQHSAIEDKETSAANEKIGESELEKKSAAHRGTITDRIHNLGYTNDCIPYHKNILESLGENASEVPAAVIDGNAHQQMTACLNLQDQIVPPYQQLNNNSLLLKPLTPYNYFYRDERDNIVLQISDESDPLPPPVSDFSIEKMRSLLQHHWYVDPVRTKRIHRKTHGKMSFQNLSKIISERWRILPSQGREFYRSVARHDEMYYNQHLANVMNNEGSTGPLKSASDDRNAEDESKPKFQLQDQIVTANTASNYNQPDDYISNDETQQR